VQDRKRHERREENPECAKQIREIEDQCEIQDTNAWATRVASWSKLRIS
jgi:hypothetical protein